MEQLKTLPSSPIIRALIEAKALQRERTLSAIVNTRPLNMQIHMPRTGSGNSEPRAKETTSTPCSSPNEQSCKNWRASRPSRNSTSASYRRRCCSIRAATADVHTGDPHAAAASATGRTSALRRHGDHPDLPGPDGRIESGEHTPGALCAGFFRPHQAGPEQHTPRAHVTNDQTPDGDIAPLPVSPTSCPTTRSPLTASTAHPTARPDNSACAPTPSTRATSSLRSRT